jgi:hypothetical protein
MPITIDLTGVTVGGAAPLEPENYPSVITKADIHPSKSSGGQTLYLELAVSYTDDKDEEKTRNMRWNTSVEEESAGRFKQLLVRLGFEIPEGPMVFDEADLVGVECVARLIQEPHYRDPERMVNKVAEILGTDTDGTGDWGGE